MDSQNIQNVSMKDCSSNPAPLGLLGFGMTTVLLNLHNAGLYPMDSMILGMGIFYGGIAQVIAGIMEWKKGNTFATTAFISYGFFWLTLVALIVIPKALLIPAPDSISMGYYLLMWGIFTSVMYFSTLKLTKAHQFVFLSLAILFFLLAAKTFTNSYETGIIAGIIGIICGFSAIYTGLAQVINENFKKIILPLGPVKS